MKITTAFPGGNICVHSINDNAVAMEADIRDTTIQWFYWMFRVDDAQEKTVHFRFPKNQVGKFGAAVSTDGEAWNWSGRTDEDECGFTYTFGENEQSVYFCHDMYYPVERFERFAAEHNLTRFPLTRSRKNREVPAYLIGDGEEYMILTSRHHACESTGTWVMEGALTEFLEHPIPGIKVLAVPFVDMDGVVDGDPGKCRAPYDHNRDYKQCMYPEIRELVNFSKQQKIGYFLDLHSPWHQGGRNDHMFVSGAYEANDGRFLGWDKCLRDADNAMIPSLHYHSECSVPFGVEWNINEDPSYCAGKRYFAGIKSVKLSACIETAYFGTAVDRVSVEKLIGTGKKLMYALRAYINGGYGK